jgi:hypothetical protein
MAPKRNVRKKRIRPAATHETAKRVRPEGTRYLTPSQLRATGQEHVAQGPKPTELASQLRAGWPAVGDPHIRHPVRANN